METILIKKVSAGLLGERMFKYRPFCEFPADLAPTLPVLEDVPLDVASEIGVARFTTLQLWLSGAASASSSGDVLDSLLSVMKI